jgi:hypothetical protein
LIIRGDEPIFIHRRTATGTDQFGNPTYSTAEILVRDALFAFGSSSEPADVNRDHIDASLTLYLPEGTVIEPSDEFEIRNSFWVKDGDPEEWPQLWAGFVPGIVIRVRRRRG